MLEKFQEWYKDNDDFHCYECNGYEVGAERAWIAALKYVLNRDEFMLSIKDRQKIEEEIKGL